MNAVLTESVESVRQKPTIQQFSGDYHRCEGDVPGRGPNRRGGGYQDSPGPGRHL